MKSAVLALIFASLLFPVSAYADLNGIVYSVPVSGNDIEVDSEIISRITDTVRLYDNTHMEQSVIQFYEKDIGVYIGLNILHDDYKDRLEKYIQLAKEHPNVIAIVLESDPIDKLSEDKIIEIVNHIKENGIKATVASTPQNWAKMPHVLKSVSFPYYYMFDYWNGFSASQSIAKLKLFHENVKQYNPVYELGFPDDGETIGNAIPSPTEQRKFFEGLDDLDVNYVLFSYSDEPEKGFKFGFFGNDAENHFGMFNGKIKYRLDEYVHPKQIIPKQSLNKNLKMEYLPELIQDKTQPEEMQEIMKVEIHATKGEVVVSYHEKKQVLQVNENLTVFLDLKDYDDVKVTAPATESISFFSIPSAFAQCDFDDKNCIYIEETDDNRYLLMIPFVIIGGIIALLVYRKYRKYRKSNLSGSDQTPNTTHKKNNSATCNDKYQDNPFINSYNHKSKERNEK